MDTSSSVVTNNSIPVATVPAPASAPAPASTPHVTIQIISNNGATMRNNIIRTDLVGENHYVGNTSAINNNNNISNIGAPSPGTNEIDDDDGDRYQYMILLHSRALSPLLSLWFSEPSMAFLMLVQAALIFIRLSLPMKHVSWSLILMPSLFLFLVVGLDSVVHLRKSASASSDVAIELMRWIKNKIDRRLRRDSVHVQLPTHDEDHHEENDANHQHAAPDVENGRANNNINTNTTNNNSSSTLPPLNTAPLEPLGEGYKQLEYMSKLVTAVCGLFFIPLLIAKLARPSLPISYHVVFFPVYLYLSIDLLGIVGAKVLYTIRTVIMRRSQQRQQQQQQQQQGQQQQQEQEQQQPAGPIDVSATYDDNMIHGLWQRIDRIVQLLNYHEAQSINFSTVKVLSVSYTTVLFCALFALLASKLDGDLPMFSYYIVTTPYYIWEAMYVAVCCSILMKQAQASSSSSSSGSGSGSDNRAAADREEDFEFHLRSPQSPSSEQAAEAAASAHHTTPIAQNPRFSPTTAVFALMIHALIATSVILLCRRLDRLELNASLETPEPISLITPSVTVIFLPLLSGLFLLFIWTCTRTSTAKFAAQLALAERRRIRRQQQQQQQQQQQDGRQPTTATTTATTAAAITVPTTTSDHRRAVEEEAAELNNLVLTLQAILGHQRQQRQSHHNLFHHYRFGRDMRSVGAGSSSGSVNAIDAEAAANTLRLLELLQHLSNNNNNNHGAAASSVPRNQGVSREYIAMLPTFPVKRKQLPPGYESCPICLCEYEDEEFARTLPCMHFFHRRCIDTWLAINRTCPICKHPCDIQMTGAAGASGSGSGSGGDVL